ncbi:YbaB/EbfC family nucleoid-associated protein [bacterium]|nr:YbaB/EbfC family nucleoid-associated protein [bacterium]
MKDKASPEMQQQIQEEMGNVQKKMALETVEGSSGGGVVTCTFNGVQQMLAIKIKPEAVDPDDIEMLEDLVMAAVNATLEKSKELHQSAMGRVAGGMLPPGMNMPF